MKQISKERLKELLKDEKELQMLYDAGVDNWDGYCNLQEMGNYEELDNFDYNSELSKYDNALTPDTLWHKGVPDKYDDFLVITQRNTVDMCHYAMDEWHKLQYERTKPDIYMWLDFQDIKPNEYK